MRVRTFDERLDECLIARHDRDDFRKAKDIREHYNISKVGSVDVKRKAATLSTGL